jgi:flagellin-specific chaperone FliS
VSRSGFRHASDMTIDDRSVDEFIDIYEDEFGERLTRKQASEIADRLITLYRLLVRKVPVEQKLTPGDDASDEYHQ